MSSLTWMSWLSASPAWMHGTKWCGQQQWLYCMLLQRQSSHPEDAVEGNQQQCPQNWEAIKEKAEELAYNDLWSDSNATVMGVDGLQGPALYLHDEAANSPPHTPRSTALCMLGLSMDHMPVLDVAVASRCAIEVHVNEAELDNL